MMGNANALGLSVPPLWHLLSPEEAAKSRRYMDDFMRKVRLVPVVFLHDELHRDLGKEAWWFIDKWTQYELLLTEALFDVFCDRVETEIRNRKP